MLFYPSYPSQPFPGVNPVGAGPPIRFAPPQAKLPLQSTHTLYLTPPNPPQPFPTLLRFLPTQSGQAPLSDLQCTTSSEALLSGKAPTFRMLVWAVDRAGRHMTDITYVVSESFVVATKRVKGAIKVGWLLAWLASRACARANL